MGSRAIKKRPQTKKKVGPAIALGILGTLVAACLACAIGVVALVSSWLTDLPDYESLGAYNASLPTEVYASDGKTLLAKFQLEYREPVELDRVSQYVLDGTVATEDERFYEHKGYDPVGIVRAAIVNFTGTGQEGASTITQQFVRNTVLSSEMNEISYKRKVREIFLASKVEESYTKEEILQMYLNTINYGSGAYGIQAASQRYFSKDATELTLAEAATLIGIPQSPTYNNPIDNPENCLKRRNLVLDRMLTNGYITQEEHDEAQAEDIVLETTEQSNDGIEAYPYFTSYVRNLLMDENGRYAYSVNEIFKGGLTVVTTLDIPTQKACENAAENKLEQEEDQMDCALAAVDPSTGHVLALVGGKDYEASEVNLATGEGGGGRPCGSAFKTFTLVSSIEMGIDPNNTMLDCGSPATVDNYTLQNFDNINYGTRSVARAFAVSSNTGFVRLISSIGVSTVIDTAKRMGITSDIAGSGAGASLTLGVANVTPLEMADAYATIANGGTHYVEEPILTITNHDGEVIVDNTNPEGEEALTPEVAYAASSVMKLVVNDYEGTGTAAAMANGQPVAAKTGTSEDFRDITFTGITPYMSLSIWLGDPSNETTLPYHTTAADVFKDVMDQLYYDAEVVDFAYADSPIYQTYFDAVYHVGGASWSTEKKETETEEEAEEEKPEDPTAEDPNANGEVPEDPNANGGEVPEDPNAGGGEVPEVPDGGGEVPDGGGGEAETLSLEVFSRSLARLFSF